MSERLWSTTYWLHYQSNHLCIQLCKKLAANIWLDILEKIITENGLHGCTFCKTCKQYLSFLSRLKRRRMTCPPHPWHDCRSSRVQSCAQTCSGSMGSQPLHDTPCQPWCKPTGGQPQWGRHAVDQAWRSESEGNCTQHKYSAIDNPEHRSGDAKTTRSQALLLTPQGGLCTILCHHNKGQTRSIQQSSFSIEGKQGCNLAAPHRSKPLLYLQWLWKDVSY